MSELIKLGMPTNPAYRPWGNRMVKLLRPECRSEKDQNGNTTFVGCQDPTIAQPDWWKTCNHNPYYASSIQKERKINTEPTEDGRNRIVGVDEFEWQMDTPNFTQVPLSIRINSGRSVENKQAKGWIMPEELGFAAFCQFVDCWSQDIKYRTAHGNYCCEWQAKVISADENEDKLEILDNKKRQRQMAAIAV